MEFFFSKIRIKIFEKLGFRQIKEKSPKFGEFLEKNPKENFIAFFFFFIKILGKRVYVVF